MMRRLKALGKLVVEFLKDVFKAIITVLIEFGW
jgi:hypothetical protein